MSIELPKDAEGREIPLDVEFLYSANGESVKPYSFTFRRYDGFCWEMHLVGAPDLVYDPKSFYLTPPDSWEKLEEDLARCSAQYAPCAYFNSSTCDCKKCAADPNKECVIQMVKNIALRVSKLRSDDDD